MVSMNNDVLNLILFIGLNMKYETKENLWPTIAIMMLLTYGLVLKTGIQNTFYRPIYCYVGYYLIQIIPMTSE
jgi:hypothetical protein